jgi:hypothetical protein
MAERTSTMQEVFDDLRALTQASAVVRSDARMSAIRRLQEQQSIALSDAVERTPLVRQSNIGDLFGGF